MIASALLRAHIDPDRPAEAVDRLLADGLGQGVDTVRRWSVGRRLDALVALRQAACGDVETVGLRCVSCQAAFEVDIDLAACRAPATDDDAAAGAADPGVVFEVEGATRHARLPTGEDHARWQREQAPLHVVADSLMEDERPCGDAAALQALGQALSMRDPLRELPVQAVCPECGGLSEHRVDLESHLVAACAMAQRELLAQVAALAEAYHWSEAEIAAMPPWRRSFYLQRLEAR